MISLDKKLILIILLWLIVLLILPINGNYLINDSYVYVWNVQNSLKTLTLHPLTSPTVIFQTFLGTLIYKLLEPNPALLRLLTYFLVLICTLTFYKLAVILNFKKNYALIVSVLLLFNPLTLTLGASFMSEIYFLTTLILAMYFSVKYKLTNQFNFLFLTSVFLSFSFLSRQIALIPIIAGLFILFNPKKKSTYILLLPLLIFVYYQFFFPKPIEYVNESILKTFFQLSDLAFYKTIIDRLISTVFYLALFFLPISITYVLSFKPKELVTKIKPLIIHFTFWGLLAAYLYLSNKILMFYIPNIISYAGFLPQSISIGIKQTWFVDSPIRIKAIITLISACSGAALSLLIFQMRTNLWENFKIKSFKSALIFSTLGMFALSIIFRDFFDRYLIVLFPLFYLLILEITNHIKLNYKILLTITFLFSLIWITFEYDYLTTNKIAWELPMQNKLTLEEFKGTFEYNHANRIDLVNEESIKLATNNIPKNEAFKYLLSYEVIDGYCKFDSKTFFTPLGKNFKNTLYIIKKCE